LKEGEKRRSSSVFEATAVLDRSGSMESGGKKKSNAGCHTLMRPSENLWKFLKSGTIFLIQI